MSRSHRLRPRVLVFTVAVAFALFLSASAYGQHYTRTDLTVDQTAVSPDAPNHDPNLVNAWGLARSSSSFWWVGDNGTGLSTLYDGTGAPQSLVVKIPLPKGQSGTAAPTGVVFNSTTGLEVAPNAKAIFIFVTEDGTISAWNPNVDRTNAILKVDRSGKANYKGVAVAQTSLGPRLYAANFQSGKVEVFDSAFRRVHPGERTGLVGHAFEFPDLSNHWAPFNVQNVGGNIVVTFAQRDPGAEDENHGAGLGFVGVFSPRGRLIGVLQHGPWFNAPWGVTLAPSDFGPFSHRLLVGNFGDGAIHAFNVKTGQFVGTVLDSAGQPLKIDGLWSLQFGGNANNSGSATELFFTAGPNDEKNGLFGKILPTVAEGTGASE